MSWTPAQKILVGAVAVVSAGYLLFGKLKPKSKSKPKPKPGVDQVPTVPKPEPKPPRPVPEPIPIPDSEGTPGIPEPPEPPEPPTPPTPPPTPTPGMEGPGGLVPEESENIPPSGWERHFNQNVMAVINEGRSLVEIRTGEDIEIYASARLFPDYTWPVGPDGAEWKKTVVSTIRGILFDLARVDDWPFSGTRETIDAATTFWVSAAKNLETCRSGSSTLDELRLCAVNATFPAANWPAVSSSKPWEREAWKRFVDMTAPDPGVVGPGDFKPAEPPGWEKRLDEHLATAIAAGREDLSVRTSQDMQAFVGRYLFPNAQWPLPGSAAPWQVDTWKTIQETLATLAEADQWPGAGDQEVVDNAITFWVSAERNVARCRTTLGLPGSPDPYGSVAECAAATTFPWVEWPPPASGVAPWRYKAWQKFEALV